METAAHTLHRTFPDLSTPYNVNSNDYLFDDEVLDDGSTLDVASIIKWVRVYKNPKTTPATAFSAENVATGNSELLPSLHFEELDPMWDPDTAIWVDFDTVNGDGSLIDTGEDSGLVTADENTTVKVGDRVAIAVKFTSWGGIAAPDMTIGPRQDITYGWQREEQLHLRG